MQGRDIGIDEAELLSVVMEGMLYGLSLLLFGSTVRALLSKRSTRTVNGKVLTVACLFLLLSTAHLVINIVRMVQGFISYRDAFPGRTVGYFADVSQWTFVSMSCIFSAQTALGDCVVLYRCYAVWQSKLVMIAPLLLWCGLVAAGIGAPITASQVKQNMVFSGPIADWITSFWVSTLSTNLLTTGLLVYRIWYVDRMAAKLYGPGRLRLRPLVYIIIDSGAIYSLTLVLTLICFLCQSNIQYILLPMVTPVISITFYMVIIRVELNRVKQTTTILLPSMDASLGEDRARRTQTRNTTLIESKIEDHQNSLSMETV